MLAEPLLIGLLVSMAFNELTGLSPGGIVVPGILALYLLEPLRLVGTLIVCLASLGVYSLLSRWLILFGRRRFFVLASTAGILAALTGLVAPALFPAAPDLRAVSFIVPGLLANTCQKQGIVPTMAATTVAVAIVALVVKLLATMGLAG
ncbi:MAG: poly-gamma-glutamate biosynthesis protein PgsC [Spirochaetales bacterium]|nr:poly-gamma-glutamate biosynthesis protein PgsC [Spirochaetales bacterium]